MAEKPKNAKGLVRAGICPYLWFMHFPSKRPDKVSCGDCVDFRSGACEGGEDPIECFKRQKPKIGDVVGKASFGAVGFMGDEVEEEEDLVCGGNCKRCDALMTLTAMHGGV